ncbi:MAG TPA: RDD family protein [Dyella sp.]|nr:RDD family protein [Dyella sp.]
MTDSPTSLPAPLWLRLVALVYDLLIVVAIMLVANMIGLALTGGHLLDEHQHLAAWWFPFFEAACVGGYFVASWRRGGQTVGMRPWRLRVVAGHDGAAAPLGRLLLRLAVAALPLLALGLTQALGLRQAALVALAAWAAWFAVALVDPRRRALHDLVAGTEVRRAG